MARSSVWTQYDVVTSHWASSILTLDLCTLQENPSWEIYTLNSRSSYDLRLLRITPYGAGFCPSNQILLDFSSGSSQFQSILNPHQSCCGIQLVSLSLCHVHIRHSLFQMSLVPSGTIPAGLPQLWWATYGPCCLYYGSYCIVVASLTHWPTSCWLV